MRTGARPRVAAGQLDKEVTIRAVVRTPDGMGGYTETPSDVATVFANIEGLEGRELVAAMQTGMQRPYRFTMRYRDDVTGVTQLIYAARTFDVKSVVDPEEKHRELSILTEEVL